MSDSARLWSDSIPKVWFKKLFFKRLEIGKMKESITQVGGQNSAHTSELVRMIYNSHNQLPHVSLFHVNNFSFVISAVKPVSPANIEHIIVDWIWGAGGLQSKTWTKSTLHNSGRFLNSSKKQFNVTFCQKVGEDSVVVTGGGASPNGVKAFVTQYSGLQEGQVDKRCENFTRVWFYQAGDDYSYHCMTKLVTLLL